MKVVYFVEEVMIKFLYNGNKVMVIKLDFSKSFIKGFIIDSFFNRSIILFN